MVQQGAKLFSERLNQCMDGIDAPSSIRERAQILSEMLDIPKQQAWSLIEGRLAPDAATLKKIATEFEVETEWLIGNQPIHHLKG